jgi:predicted membrane-bound spermidine synthase
MASWPRAREIPPMAPVIASTAAAAFLALAAFALSSPGALLILSAAAFAAYWTHDEALSYSLRLVCYLIALGLGLLVWLYLALGLLL